MLNAGMRVITRKRIILAFAIALATDAIQILLGPLGVFFIDEAMDVVAMVLISWVIGFHPLLLPTFIVELFPVVDMAPTWTVCTAIVVSLRRQRRDSPEPAVQPSAPPPAREPRPIQGTDRSVD